MKDIIPADDKAVKLGKAKPVDVVCQDEEPTREELLIRNLFVYDSQRQAALEAGYSEGYANTAIYAKIKSPGFQQKIIDYAKANNIINLPAIAKLEGKALRHLATLDGDELIKGLAKTKHTLTQTKQIAGLLRPEDSGSAHSVTIAIKDVQNMMIKG